MKITLQLTDTYPEKYVLDNTKYRGKGRPRKIDYTEMTEYMVKKQKVLNTLLNSRIESQLYDSTPPATASSTNRKDV